MHGLTAEQVEASRQRYGVNVLTPPRRKSLICQFLEKFNDPLIRILLVALLLSVGISAYEYLGLKSSANVLLEPLGIFIAIVLATLIGFLVEVNANKKFDLLNLSNDDIKVKVRRNGHITQVPRRDIVVGDIVILETGEKVPADGVLLDSINLTVNESSLTGEPVARKSHRPEDASRETTYSVNELKRGSTITEGHCTMLVRLVGDATEYGKVFRDAQTETDVRTPLTLQFERLGHIISWGSYIIAALIIVGRMLVFFLDDRPDSALESVQYFIQTIMLAVTLIVVSVPEGLPMSVTLALALSMRRMLKTNNLVRRLHACETMGATTVICTDKTGTLTQNQMQVYEARFYDLPDGSRLADDELSAIVQESIACNSTAFLDDSSPGRLQALGNPTEGALLLWLHDAGIDYLTLRNDAEVLAQLPFSTERKYMATVIQSALTDKRLLLLKGAPEIVLRMSATRAGGKTVDDIESDLLRYQGKAMRTLGFACRELAPDEQPDQAIESLKRGEAGAHLHMLGIVAISDPVRADVPAAIVDCRSAGVSVKIVTGDTTGTAREVGRQVGLWTDADGDQAVISGPEFAALPDDEAAQRARQVKIMSRARPDDKARLVRLLQQQGEVVAVTGDGTNDAPALNAAQVGLSMGDGTSVAKEASDITILDNSFASINKAVLWGRSLYRNIQRFILFQLAVNVCACLVVAVCSFFSKQPALTVTQMLWVNLIMDTFAALALASLPPNSIVMRSAPRRSTDSIITRSMTRFILATGLLFAVVMITLYLWMCFNGGGTWSFSYHPNISPRETTVYFTTFVFLQFWNLFNAKSFGSGHSAFHNVHGGRVFFVVAVAIFIGQILIVELGGAMFNCTHLPLSAWLTIILCTSPVMLVGEIYHRLRPRR